jgi:hypothetical protein
MPTMPTLPLLGERVAPTGVHSGISPQELTERRRIAELLLSGAFEDEKIEHPLQGVAKMAQALAGGLGIRRMERQEREGRYKAAERFMAALSDSNAPPGRTGTGTRMSVPPAPSSPAGGAMAARGLGGHLDPQDLDMIVRTVYGEAAGEDPTGQAAVASVILNRARQSGKSPRDVVLAPNQFEPWSARRSELEGLDPNSPQYQAVLANIQSALSGEDPTGGASHFYAPAAQKKLGRAAPSWDDGTGQDIGNHRFFTHGYAPQPSALPTGGPQTGIQLAGGMEASGLPPAVLEALTDPWMEPWQKQYLLERYAQPEYGFTELGGDVYRTNPRAGSMELLLDRPDAPPDPFTLGPNDVRFSGTGEELARGAPKPPEYPGEVQEYQFYAEQEIAQGREPKPFGEWRLEGKKAGATNIDLNTAEGGDAKLRGALGAKEGERWSTLKEAGVRAAGLAQDFEVVDALLTVAPQGPLKGRLAEMFPGFSTAGDAMQSIVYRLAPTLRVPGSGATSDLEYEGMLKSLTRLRNDPQANRLIAEMVKAKAGLDVERSQIVTAFENERMTAAQARDALDQLNRRSIMSPQLRTMLQGIGAAAKGTTSSGVKWSVEGQ